MFKNHLVIIIYLFKNMSVDLNVGEEDVDVDVDVVVDLNVREDLEDLEGEHMLSKKITYLPDRL